MIRYAAINRNDAQNGEGICVSYWAQGCPIRCEGCHNESVWDPKGGTEEENYVVLSKISDALRTNGIKRNFSILGGEPLAPFNIASTNIIGYFVKNNFPDSKIFLWTGYTLEELEAKGEPYIYCLNWADVIIDGPFLNDQRDISLKLRGSSNQRILEKGKDF